MEITVNLAALDSSITRLNALRGKLSGLNKTQMVTLGMDGDVCNNLKTIITLYKETGQAFTEIIDRSIAFLENAKQQMVASDQAAGQIINQSVCSN